MSQEIEKQKLLAELKTQLKPEEAAKVKSTPVARAYPAQLRGFKITYNVGQIGVATDVKIKLLEVPPSNTVLKSRVTGNPIKNSAYDKGTGNILPKGYGFKKTDSITGQEVFTKDQMKVQLTPAPNSPTGFKEEEVKSFDRTQLAEIKEDSIFPRPILNEYLIEKEYEIYGTGAELFKIVKDLAVRKSVARIDKFVLVEGDSAYRAFLVPPPVVMEDKFYALLVLARRKRENLIGAWLSAKDTIEISAPKKVKQGREIDITLD